MQLPRRGDPVSRQIAIADGKPGFRAVTVHLDGNNEQQIIVEGVYDKPGTARQRVTFWRNHLGPEWWLDGWIEAGSTSWSRVDAPEEPDDGETTVNDMVHTFLNQHGLKGVAGVEAFIDALLDQHAHELAEVIRAETQRLRDDDVLEPDRYRPCRDAANQIDPRTGSG